MCWTGNGALSFGPAKAPPVAPNALWRGRRHAFQKSKVGYESKTLTNGCISSSTTCTTRKSRLGQNGWQIRSTSPPYEALVQQPLGKPAERAHAGIQSYHGH